MFLVLLDHPDSKSGKPVRCGKKFSRVAARKLKSSEIIFVCKGAGKTASLGRLATDARIYIKKRIKKGTKRCLNFSGITFNTVQDDLAVMSEWTEWTECMDDQSTRNRTCTGIFCEEESEMETKNEPCLTCDAGFEPNEEKTECVDIDECMLDQCPENSECTNLVGSYNCVCNDGMYGDDMNFCIPPRACHGDTSSGCECNVITPMNTTEFITSWNNTANECTVEYVINFPYETVNSWSASLDFEKEAKVMNIWRARTDMNTLSYDHGLETMYFNVEQVMEMRLHAGFMVTCDEVGDIIPTVTLCTEPVAATTTTKTATTTTTIAITPTMAEIIVTEPPPPQLSEETCDAVTVSAQNSWMNEEEQTVTQVAVSIEADMVHEWRVELPFDDLTTVVAWGVEPSLSTTDTWMLTAAEYNIILHGRHTFSLQVIGDIATDDDGNLLHGSFCYKQEV